MYRENLEDMPRELEREILFKIFKGAVSYGNIVPLMEKTSTKHNAFGIIECLEDDFGFPDFWVITEANDLVNDNIFIVFARSLTAMEELSFRYAISLLNLEDEIEPFSLSSKFGVY